MNARAASTATAYTYDFVCAQMPEAATDVLEIGCGRGELAARLAADGLRVTAVDSSPGCVEAAAALGVDARLLSWPAEMEERFDAILFTRSLHHISSLCGSVEAACAVLRPRGRLIVEDFRSEGAGARSSAWYRGLASTLYAAGALRDDFDLADCVEDDVAHHHDLHSSADIETALGCFRNVRAEDSAYYFRYLEDAFRNAAACEHLLGYELQMIETGAIRALGRRFVADNF